MGVLLVLAMSAGDVFSLLPDEYRETFAQRGTLDERMEVWAEALIMYSRPDFGWQMFGRPIGVPLALQLEQGEWSYSIHSSYVGILLSYGILGSLLWAALLVAALLAALRPRGHVVQRFDLEPSVAVCWLLIYFIYGYSYEWSNGSGVFIGMAMIPLIRRDDAYG